MEPSPKKEKLADPEAENSHPPQQDELSEEKNNDNDKNAGDTGEERNEETQHLDELMGEDIDQSEEVDKRSIYVKNVDYLATREEVIEHFKECGKVNRVTILTDKYTGNPKGYAYIEFEDVDGVENAKLLSDSLLRGRQIKVLPKRTNKPFKGKRRPGRGPRFAGGYGFRGYYRGYGMFSGPPRGRRGYKPY